MRTFVWVILFIAVTGFMAFLWYSPRPRPYVPPKGRDTIYQMDHKGKMHKIQPRPRGSTRGSESPAKSTSLEGKAIGLAQGSYALGGTSKVKDIIQERMKAEGGEPRIVGWRARRTADQRYLVSYTYYGDSGERGWLFEVDLVEEKVRCISSPK
jgi:hypothetical protein